MQSLTQLTKFINIKRLYSTCKGENVKICIIGGGAAGFYAAQQFIKLLPSSCVDIFERLPVPFGLVRFGVAPDHPEVKNVINTFTKTARHPSVNLYGNLALGKDFFLKDLKNAYHAILLSYGSEEDRTLDIPGEDLNNVIPARRFVGWYNGLPSDRDLNVDLDCDTAVVLGQGNVAIDVARILLSPIDKLKATDITEYALERLCRSKVNRVQLVGRRGPMQVAFTIKELREIVSLPGVQTIFNKDDFNGINDLIPSLGRPRKRLTELLYKSAMEVGSKQQRELRIIFKRSPVAVLGSMKVEGLQMAVNKLEGEDWETQKAVQTNLVYAQECGLLLRSIGYKGIPADSSLPFDKRRGVVISANGKISEGMYCCGWLSTGPVGVILSTMSNAFATAQLLHQDIVQGRLDVSESKPGATNILQKAKNEGTPVVTFEDWEKISLEEERRGKEKGKIREKIVCVEEMLAIASGR